MPLMYRCLHLPNCPRLLTCINLPYRSYCLSHARVSIYPDSNWPAKPNLDSPLFRTRRNSLGWWNSPCLNSVCCRTHPGDTFRILRRLDTLGAAYQRPTSPNAHAGRLHGILGHRGPGEAVPSAPLRVGFMGKKCSELYLYPAQSSKTAAQESSSEVRWR